MVLLVVDSNIKHIIQSFIEIASQQQNIESRFCLIKAILLEIQQQCGQVVLNKDIMIAIAKTISPVGLDIYKQSKFEIFSYKYTQYFYEQLPKQTGRNVAEESEKETQEERTPNNSDFKLKPEDCIPMQYDEEWLNSLGWERRNGE